MPTYQYACTDNECGNRFELVQSFTDPAASECPVCHHPVRKVYGSVGVVFKGSGFYRTDSRAESRAESRASAAESSGAKSDSKTDSKSDSKSDSRSDSKSGSKSESKSDSKSSDSTKSKPDVKSGASGSKPAAAASA